jgi:hypothetical protein
MSIPRPVHILWRLRCPACGKSWPAGYGKKLMRYRMHYLRQHRRSVGSGEV